MFVDFRRFCLIFVDFRWFLLIFVDFRWFLLIFHWFSLIFVDFHWFSLIELLTFIIIGVKMTWIIAALSGNLLNKQPWQLPWWLWKLGLCRDSSVWWFCEFSWNTLKLTTIYHESMVSWHFKKNTATLYSSSDQWGKCIIIWVTNGLECHSCAKFSVFNIAKAKIVQNSPPAADIS